MIVPVHHLVGAHEIGVLLGGLSRQRVYQLTSRNDFPAPAVVLKGGSVWHREDVEAWARRTGRLDS
ncbi:MAG: helix-turn-helix transcriptional regulator [Blastococcus sp.]